MADLLMKMPVPYEPKRKNRFILRFPSTLGINEWYVTSTSRPSAKIKSVSEINTSIFELYFCIISNVPSVDLPSIIIYSILG